VNAEDANDGAKLEKNRNKKQHPAKAKTHLSFCFVCFRKTEVVFNYVLFFSVMRRMLKFASL